MIFKIMPRIIILSTLLLILAKINLLSIPGIEAQTVVQNIEDIVTMVNDFYDNGQFYGSDVAEVQNSLLQELEEAIETRDRNQPSVTCNKLKSFSNQVEAKKDKNIEVDAAEELIEAAGNACTEIIKHNDQVHIAVRADILPSDPRYMAGYGPDEGVTTTVRTISGEYFPLEPADARLSEAASGTSTENDDIVSVEVEEGTELSDEDVQEEGITVTVEIVDDSLIPVEPIPERSVDVQAEIIDNWELLMEEDFEGDFPQPSCQLFHGVGTAYAFWGADDFRQKDGDKAGWPAAYGADSVDPEVSDYPSNVYSILKCGPYDRSNAKAMLVKYDRWLEILDPDDQFAIGYSFDDETYHYTQQYGVRDYWVSYQLKLHLVEGGSGNVWFKWRFWSDDDDNRAEGVWIDNLEIWRYNQPTQVCGNEDPGKKGLVLEPYQWVGNQQYPIIRSGYEDVLEELIASDVKWVRMGFQTQNGIIEYQDYDPMIDTLCANGINVLGLVNHQTLLRQDINDPETAGEYRNDFANEVGFIVNHFRNRITYWEVWNEPDYDPDPGSGTLPPRMEPEFYAPLLVETAQKIKEENQAAKILHGGLASAWDQSYFDDVYEVLGGGPGPFDYFAIHPYFDETHGYDPEYLRAESPTILAKFMDKMSTEGDGQKLTWATEIGWNSAKDNPHPCWPHMVSEDEQAAYLKKGFDILFNEVKLSDSSCPAIKKAVWYQFMDVSIPEDDLCQSTVQGARHWKGDVPTGGVQFTPLAQENTIPWYWGLYKFDANYNLVAKPSQSAFAAYPQSADPLPTLPYSIYLPVILSGGSDVQCPE